MLGMPGGRGGNDTTALAVPGRRNSHPTPAIVKATVSKDDVAFDRRKSDRRMKTLSAVSDLEPKSCNTEENCGKTNRIKNSMTQTAAIRTKTGYCIASVSLRRICSDLARSAPSISST